MVNSALPGLTITLHHHEPPLNQSEVQHHKPRSSKYPRILSSVFLKKNDIDCFFMDFIFFFQINIG